MKSMNKQLITITATVVLCGSASAQVAPDKICYDLSPNRYNTDLFNSTVYFDKFEATPSTPGAPAINSGNTITFGMGFSGTAPTQAVVAPPAFGFSWDPAETTDVSLTGLLGLPTGFDYLGETYDLCHTCYDFSFDFGESIGSITVYDAKTKEIIRADEKGNYVGVTGPVVISTKDFQAKTVTAVFDNVEACYCVVPEPSSTALLGLGSLALVLRRRR